MIKKIVFILLLLILIPKGAFSQEPQEKVEVTVFHSFHCGSCLRLKLQFYPKIKEKYAGKLEWKELNTDSSRENLAYLYSVTARLKKGEAPATPAILVGDSLIVGNAIERELEAAIDEALTKEKTIFDFVKVDLLQVFKHLSPLTVTSAGLIDGINPCAFAVIVFFISFLTVYGYRKKEIICVGFSYCLAVFITYLLMGLGIFGFIYKFSRFYDLRTAFYVFVAAFCFFLAGLTIYDYIKLKRGKGSADMSLQLPAFLKKKISVVIASPLREKKDRGAISLIITSFGIGFLVSLLEAACTGQIYLPIIIYILKTAPSKFKAISYLFLYNIMFILPLLVIFALSFIGVSSQRFNDFLKGNLAKMKIAMAILFFVLGALILLFKS